MNQQQNPNFLFFTSFLLCHWLTILPARSALSLEPLFTNNAHVDLFKKIVSFKSIDEYEDALSLRNDWMSFEHLALTQVNKHCNTILWHSFSFTNVRDWVHEKYETEKLLWNFPRSRIHSTEHLYYDTLNYFKKLEEQPKTIQLFSKTSCITIPFSSLFFKKTIFNTDSPLDINLWKMKSIHRYLIKQIIKKAEAKDSMCWTYCWNNLTNWVQQLPYFIAKNPTNSTIKILDEYLKTLFLISIIDPDTNENIKTILQSLNKGLPKEEALYLDTQFNMMQIAYNNAKTINPNTETEDINHQLQTYSPLIQFAFFNGFKQYDVPYRLMHFPENHWLLKNTHRLQKDGYLIQILSMLDLKQSPPLDIEQKVIKYIYEEIKAALININLHKSFSPANKYTEMSWNLSRISWILEKDPHNNEPIKRYCQLRSIDTHLCALIEDALDNIKNDSTYSTYFLSNNFYKFVQNEYLAEITHFFNGLKQNGFLNIVDPRLKIQTLLNMSVYLAVIKIIKKMFYFIFYSLLCTCCMISSFLVIHKLGNNTAMSKFTPVMGFLAVWISFLTAWSIMSYKII